jgi:hypothetical protein
MKRFLIALFISSMALFNCYDGSGNFTRAFLLLGPIPSGIVNVHIGVFAVVINPSTLILKTSLPVSSISGQVVPLIIPNSTIVNFLVWGESNIPGPGAPVYAATHVGYSLPVIMNGENIFAVPVVMTRFDSAYNLVYDSGTQIHSWNAIYGATEYELTVNGGIEYTGPMNFYQFTAGSGFTHSVRCYSSIFNLWSQEESHVH